MAPFPEEVDVFTAPHWRMKQLVGLYCDKVTVCGASSSGRRGRRGGAGRAPGRPRPAPLPQPPGPRRTNCRLRSCQRRARSPAPSPGEPAPPSGRWLRRALGAGDAALPAGGLGTTALGAGSPRARRVSSWCPLREDGHLRSPLTFGDSAPVTGGGFPIRSVRPFPRLFPA